ncbi:MAG TPA: CHASE2 domain-containing protein [Paenalcaligenes sp.]|nr:CHASE2 domain-containing protein [Paenalcaligenes sp.]
MRRLWPKKNLFSNPTSAFAAQIRRDSWWVTFWLVLFVVILCFSTPRLPLERLDNIIYDFQLRLQPTPTVTAESPIALIIIDDYSLRTLGHWPWRRKVYAELLEHLDEAKAVGIDLLFTSSNPAYPEDDKLLADAIQKHGRIILPVYIDRNDSLEQPIPPLVKAAAGLGFINIQPDADGVVRHIKLFHELNPGARQNGEQHRLQIHSSPSISDAPRPPSTDNDFGPNTTSHFSTVLLSVSDDAKLLDNYGAHYKAPHLSPFIGPFGSFPTYSFGKVLKGEYPANTFKDKYVLIGAWSSGLGDFYPTPFSSTENTSMSGVEILANATNNLLHNQWIHKTPNWAKALANILPVIFICLSLRQLSPRYAFFGTSLVIAALFVGNWVLLHVFHLWIPIGSALVGSVISYPLWYWRSQETVLRYVDKQLSELRQHNPGLSQALDISEVQLTIPARLNHLYKSIELLREAEQRRVETLNFISHDMRAPQNSILALVDVERQQQNNENTAKQEQFYQRLENYASNTLNLVDDFIDFARVESSAFELQPLVLNDLVTQAIDDIWAIATQKNIAMHYQDPERIIWIQGHQSFLHRVLTNLLDNAVKYSPKHTTVFTSVSTHKDQAVIRIQDQGWGIPQDQLQHVFSAFKRFHTSHAENPKGTGLGLAFVHTVIGRHRGRIEVESNLNLGTTFTIYLPLIY